MAGSAPDSKTALPIYEGPDEARLRAWLMMVDTVTRLERRICGLLGENELTLPQFEVLVTLKFGEGVTQKELAERLLVTKGNVCGVLDRLERMRLVERRTDDHDARVNRLHLTPAGRRKIDAALPRHDKLVLALFNPIANEDIRTLRRVLQHLEQALR